MKPVTRGEVHCAVLNLIAAAFLSVFAPGTEAAVEVNPTNKPPLNRADLFTMTNVWTVHLKFTPEQWQAMEPKQDGPGGFGGPRFGGPGGPRGGRGGPPGGGFGPGMFLTPAFLQQADQNHDGTISSEEFAALGTKWFAEWDKAKTGKLDAEQLRAGLNASLAQGEFGPPGGGGPGGRRGGMNLQGPEGKRNGLSSAAGIEFSYVHADLEFEGQLLKDVAVRYKGNGTFMQSRGSQKRSLKLDVGKYAKGQKLAGVSRLNLHNNVTDASWMNEVLSHALFRDGGVPAPATAYARVYVTVPGQHQREYLGLYSLVENIDREFTEEHFQTKKGAVLKPVTPELFADLGDDWKKYQQTYDPKVEMSAAQKQRVIDCSKLVSKASDPEFAARLPEFLDLEEFARFMAVTAWLSTIDSILAMGQNFYVYMGKDHKFQFLPWDLDHSFGQFGMRGSQVERENLDIRHPWQGENRFLERCFKVEAFQKLYLARMDKFSQTIFQPDRFITQVDQIALAIRPAVQQESADKLAAFDKVVAGETVQPAGFGGFGGRRRSEGGEGGPGGGDVLLSANGRPSGGRPNEPGQGGPRMGGPGGFFQPAKPIKAFVKARAAAVREQLAGKSEGKTLGQFGFGRPDGGRGGRGGGPGPGGFGPGNFIGDQFMAAMDLDKDGSISRAEFTDTFGKWFQTWNSDHTGHLTEEQLRAGINQDLSPFRAGRGFGFGPPDGPPRGDR